MVLTSSRRQAGAIVIAREVRRLWHGALFVMVDLSFDGFDVVPDIVGMVLVVVACRRLLQLAPADQIGRTGVWLAMGTTALTAFAIVPEWRRAVPEVGRLTDLLTGIGITFMAFYLHRLTRSHNIHKAADRWLLAGRAFLVVDVATLLLHLAFFVADGNTTPQISWNLTGFGAFAVVMLTILALGSGILWLRAAWTTWKTAESDAAIAEFDMPALGPQ